MLAAGVVLMAIMMGGMLFMHLGNHGHSGHAGHGDVHEAGGGDASTTTAKTHQVEGM